jgi:hypothetical protein
LTAVLLGEKTALVESLASNAAVDRILLIDQTGEESASSPEAQAHARVLKIDSPRGAGFAQALDAVETDYLLLFAPGEHVRLGQLAIERFLSVAEDTGAGLVYSDFKDEVDGQLSDHPLIDYQTGSIRDTFDFGPVLLVSRRAATSALSNHGPINERLAWAGFYDLRLKLSIDSLLLRIPEPLYTRIPFDRRASGERQFDYVDPLRRDYQIEMEQVATEHLKRVGAYLAPEFLSRPRIGALIASGSPPHIDQEFPVRASVIIPVRNRERTIREAVLSALAQQTAFDFNVIVVDNHSTDRTTEIVAQLARDDGRLVHIKPARTDLGIGGCWNEAIYSRFCGEYAVQLDSDDLYADGRTLKRIIEKFDEGAYAMVIGSYTIVNFELEPIPPGLIDHREWTRENGRNNALRINGLGAPRAFYVPVLRQIGLPNTSYGEDYAAALRISRHYDIGRIYDSIYFARRWEGNSDALLPITTANRYDSYKDYLRTVEIQARKRMNQQ